MRADFLLELGEVVKIDSFVAEIGEEIDHFAMVGEDGFTAVELQSFTILKFMLGSDGIIHSSHFTIDRELKNQYLILWIAYL